MGQQQLLLQVLAVVIVGLSVVSGIQSYTQYRRTAGLDLVYYEAVRLASQLATWKMTPGALGGGSDDAYFESASLQNFGFTNVQTTTAFGDEVEYVVQGERVYALWGKADFTYRTVNIAVYDTAIGVHTSAFPYGVDANCVVGRAALWTGNDSAMRPDASILQATTWEFLGQVYPEVPNGCTNPF
ncbi:MAG: hypothetical protein AAF809_01895 [Bacteroidota bacterium]